MLKNDVGSTSHINVEKTLNLKVEWMLKNDVGSTPHINVEPMLMQGSINVEFSVSSTAILLAWY
jgi:hypothetical protein